MANLANPMPALDPNERAALKESIERDGMLVPVLKSAGPFAKGQIVDGFNRSSIWKELGRPEHSLPTLTREFKNEAEFRIAQIDANLARRQLSLPQRIQLAISREPWEKKLARDRMAAGGGVEKSRQPGGTLRASAAAAEAVGLKRDTYEHGKFVLQHAPEEIKAAFQAGGMSVDRAYRETKRAIGLDTSSVLSNAVAKRVGKFPSGKFGCVVASPPWRAGNRAEAGRLSLQEIAALPVPNLTAMGSIVAVLAPAAHVADAISVLSAWNAQFVTTFAWRAPGLELALVGVTGRASIAENLSLWIDAISRAGKPPAAFWRLMDELAPDSAGIALFTDVERDGWTAWNPEIK